MSPTKALVVAVALGSLLAAPASAQVPSELRATMLSRDVAVAKADADTWGRLTAETFTVVQEDGSIMTKAERLAQMKTQTPSTPTPHQREQIDQYGDVFVRRFLAGGTWVLDIWAKNGGTWRVVAVQVTTAKK